MTVLRVSHLTLYRYRQPVSFGEHRSDTAALLMTRRPGSSESATSDARYHAAAARPADVLGLSVRRSQNSRPAWDKHSRYRADSARPAPYCAGIPS